MAELQEIRSVFQGLESLYSTYLPKADPILIHDLLIREKKDAKIVPLYMVEIFRSYWRLYWKYNRRRSIA